MADEFDPLKQTTNKPPEELYSTIQKITKHSDDDLLRPQYESVLKRDRPEPNTPTEERPQKQNYEKLDFTRNAAKAPTRPTTNPFAEDAEKSPLPSQNAQQPSSKPPPSTAKVSDQRAASSWENNDNYHSNYPPTVSNDSSSSIVEQNYGSGPPPAYYPEEYYEDESVYKKRGISATIDRIVQRFPALGLFYKSSTSADVCEGDQGHEYVEEETEDDQAPQLVDGTTLSRELTADELALGERYSNKLRTQIIDLQAKDQTQPVDVSIHHDSYTIYSCDVGRSVVEIFDMYGKLQHVIDDQTTVKFQPSAIAVAYDGTIIVSSHFNHRLHMYSPIDPPEVSEHTNSNETVDHGYRFTQYKLGAPGHNLHEFHHPAGISIDCNDGYLYVCDRGNYRIQVLRPEGVCERVIELLLQDEELSHVSPVQTAHQQNGDQLVCIIGAGDAICFIPKYTDGEVYVEPLYILDNDGLGLQGASGIAVDCNDRIFISDTGHNRIVVCTPEGSYITHFGVEGNGPGELKRPCGLDITNDGTVVVADSGNKRIQLFGSIREQSVEEKKPSAEKSNDKNNLSTDPERNLM